jgi:hypothetical protein
MLVLITAGLLANTLQKPLADNVVFSDVPDNHFVYGLLLELRTDGLLPELVLPLSRGNRPLTRGEIGCYICEATLNLQRYVDERRPVNASNGEVTFSGQLSNLTGDQLKYFFALTPRIRRVAKLFATNLPPFVKWKELDQSLDGEKKLIDGLIAAA